LATATDRWGQDLLLTGFDGVLAAGVLDVLGADVVPPRVAGHG
jgi:hypothetical protein